ncbi:Protein yippee-like 1, partial [Ophiophagus hannah]
VFNSFSGSVCVERATQSPQQQRLLPAFSSVSFVSKFSKIVSQVPVLIRPKSQRQKCLFREARDEPTSLILVNVGCGPAEERVLLTGLHAVADIYCENCKTTLGWKY